MRYPNLRYGNPTALAFYAAGIPLPALARRLRRDERTVSDWINGKTRVPWWVPEILRLQAMEQADMLRQHMQFTSGFTAPRKLATVTHTGQLELRRAKTKTPQTITELRRDGFDQESISA